jgi:hydroxypyruvate isomerase
MVAGSALSHTSQLFGVESASVANKGEVSGVPFNLSIMLWTVFTNLPFEQRLEKIAEAGFRNVELVGEYDNWTETEFKRANAKRKELGISFDCTAGLKHGVSIPDHRQPAIESPECLAMFSISVVSKR